MIDFVFEKSSLAVRYSDGGGKPDPVVDVLDLKGTWIGRRIRVKSPIPFVGTGEQPPTASSTSKSNPAAARKVLFVRVGQDEPLFDEKTLRLLRRADEACGRAARW